MSITPTPQEGTPMTFDLLSPAHSVRSPRVRELIALATAVDARMMADPPSGGDGSGESGSASQEGAGDGDQHGQDGDGDGDGDQPPSWDEIVAGLPEDQQAVLRAEIERRERDNRKARSEARNLRTRAQEAEAKAAKVDEADAAKKTAEQHAAEATATVREENEGLRRRLVSQQIKVQAAPLFADPDDPAELLAGQVADLMDTDLEPDEDAIGDALKDLLERKPHLAKRTDTATTPRPPAPTKAQGSSGSSPSTPGSRGLAEAQRRFGTQKQAS